MAMMDCPRCGFSQPKDRYCANCGLDAETYQVKPTPPLKKLRRNPYVYIALTIAVFVYIGFKIAKDDSFSPPSTESLDRQASFEQSELPEARPPESTAVVAQKTEPRTQTNVEEPSQEIAPETMTVTSTPSVVEPPVNEPTAETQAELPATFSQLEVLFFEVPSSLLTELIEPGEILSETIDYKTLLHPKKEEVIQLLEMGQRMPGAQMIKAEANQRLQVQFTNPQSAASIFSIESSILRTTSKRADLTVRTLLNLVEVDARLRFSTNVNLTADNVLIIIGLLPHLEVSPYSADIWQGTPLQLISDPDFQDKLSEFVVFVGLR